MLEWSLKGEAVLGLQVYIPSAQCFLCGPAPLAHPPPTQDSVPTGDAAKANSSDEASLSYWGGERDTRREGGGGLSYHLAQWDLLGSRMCEEGVMTLWPCYVYDVVVSKARAAALLWGQCQI